MNTVKIIPGYSDPYYFQYLFEGEIKTGSHNGSELSLRRKILLMRVDAILDLICQFRHLDDEIIDHHKNTHVHTENRVRIKNFVDWALDNREKMPGSIVQNGSIVADRYMKPIVDMIQNEQPLKEKIVSLMACVIETSKYKDDENN